jgi:hypothetical protein
MLEPGLFRGPTTLADVKMPLPTQGARRMKGLGPQLHSLRSKERPGKRETTDWMTRS